MDRHTIIFSSDNRQKKLAELLRGTKIECSFEEYEAYEAACEDVQRVYVLPTPVSKLDFSSDIADCLKEKLLREHFLHEKHLLFGGAFSGEWEAFFQKHKIPFVDFMRQEDVTLGNAYITAEAVLAELLQLSLYSICGQNILVTGFGRCAKQIARMLTLLGARITIVARKESALEEAKMQGYQVCSFSDLIEQIPMYQSVVNTVPAMVLTEDVISRMQKDAIILDIASKPGGTDFEAAKRYGIVSKLALGLPGIYSTKSSALLLEKNMLQYAPFKEQERGERSWIFQIII